MSILAFALKTQAICDSSSGLPFDLGAQEEPFGTEDRSGGHEIGHLLGLIGLNHSLLLGSTRTHFMAS